MTKPAYKTLPIVAEMYEIEEKVIKKRQTGTRVITKTKGLLKKETYEVEEPVYEEYEEWVPSGRQSDTQIDIISFSRKIMDVCNLLAAEGYEVVHISDVIRGRYQYRTWEGQNIRGGPLTRSSTWGAGWGYGYGYSITQGVVITAKLVNV